MHIGIFQLREKDVFFNVARLGVKLQRNTLEVDIPSERRGKKTLGGRRLGYACHTDKQTFQAVWKENPRCASNLRY